MPLIARDIDLRDDDGDTLFFDNLTEITVNFVDVVDALVLDSDVDLSASDIMFTSATLEGAATSFANIGFSYTAGAGDDGTLLFDLDDAPAFTGNDADPLQIVLTFEVNDGTTTDLGFIEFSVETGNVFDDDFGFTPTSQDISVDFRGPFVEDETVTAEAVAGATEAIFDVDISGITTFDDFFSGAAFEEFGTVDVDDDGVDLSDLLAFRPDDLSLYDGLNVAFAAAGGGSIATASVTNGGLAEAAAFVSGDVTATASDQSFAAALGFLGGPVTAAAQNLSTALAISEGGTAATATAIDESSASALADSSSTATASAVAGSSAGAAASDSSVANTDAANGSDALSSAFTGSAASAIADEDSIVDVVSLDGSAAEGTATATSQAFSVATDSSVATAIAHDVSAAQANANGTSSATSFAATGGDATTDASTTGVANAAAIGAAEVIATASNTSDALAYGNDADATATANETSSASAAAELGGTATASATAGSTSTATSATGSTALAVAVGNSVAQATGYNAADASADASDNTAARARADNANAISNSSGAAASDAIAFSGSNAQAAASDEAVATAIAADMSTASAVASASAAARAYAAAGADDGSINPLPSDLDTDVALSNLISDVTSDVTVTKAQIADVAMNAITSLAGSDAGGPFEGDAPLPDLSAITDRVLPDAPTSQSGEVGTSDAAALAENGSTAESTASDDSSATATADNTSRSTATAASLSVAVATSDDASEAAAFANTSSAANADAADAGTSDAVAIDDSAASATALSNSDALAFAEANSASQARATETSSASATAETGSAATATAADDSTSTAQASDAATATADARQASVAGATASANSTANSTAEDGSAASSLADDDSDTSSSAARESVANTTAFESSTALAAADLESQALAFAEMFSSAETNASAQSVASTIAENDSTAIASATTSSNALGLSSGSSNATTDAKPFSGAQGSTIIVPIDVDVTPDAQTIVFSGLPAGSQLSAGTPNADGTVFTINGPLPPDLSLTTPVGFSGMFELTAGSTAGDERAEAVQTVTITPVDGLAPIAESDTASITEGTTDSIDVLANDTDPDGDDDGLTIVGVTQGTKGSVVIAEGGVGYSANEGAQGTDTFTYTIQDEQGLTATATVDVTLVPNDDAPNPPVINEVSINGWPGGDYVEIFGDPNTDYSMCWLVVLEGDDAENPGLVLLAEQLPSTNADGYALVDLQGTDFDPGTVTFLIVDNYEVDGVVIGEPGVSDFDGNDDGAIDAFYASSFNIVDDVAVDDGDTGDLTYTESGTVLDPSFDAGRYDGTSASTPPTAASRLPNGIDTDSPDDWSRNERDGLNEAGEAADTPGTENQPVTVAPTPEIAISDASVVEGEAGAQLVFTVTKSEATQGETVIGFSVGAASDTATAGVDYVDVAPGTVTFGDGETTPQEIIIPIIDDTDVEADETVTVTITDAANNGAPLNVVDATGTGTIIDDDEAAPVPSVSISDASIVEGNDGTTVLQFAVTKSFPTEGGSSIAFQTVDETATAGEDYVARSDTIFIADGETEGSIDIVINGDTDIEADETFTVEIAQADNAAGPLVIADGVGTGTIINDDEDDPPSDNDPITLCADASMAGSLGPVAFGNGVTIQGFDLNGDAAPLGFGSGGLGVDGDQFGLSGEGVFFQQVDFRGGTDGASERLRITFETPAEDINLVLGRQFENEAGRGERAFYMAYDEDGTLIGQGLLETDDGTPAGENVWAYDIGLTGVTHLDLMAADLYAGGPQGPLQSDFNLQKLTYTPDGALDTGAPVASITGPSSTGEGSTVTFVAQLDAATTEDVTVTYELISGSAVAGVDVQDLSGGSVVIPAGDTEAPIDVLLVDDNLPETFEAFEIGLVRAETASGANLGLDPFFNTVEHVIIDDDVPAEGVSFALVDADLNQVIETIENNDTIDLAGRSLSIIAVPGGISDVESVLFTFDGTDVRTENFEPYALFGDATATGDFFSGNLLTPGDHTLEVAGYNEDGAQGDLLFTGALDFTVTDDDGTTVSI